ncbi:hypothetical protein BN2497_12479 [Janthinobacterium sp. CG23_2]|nr:hypothetical protein BN2497_12479 [Janthinobacterium sp. CG23_2]CUU32637.1 hypothetical protein BN3177_12479 [Janthinobacterium sp. CG23_2]
MITWRIDDMAFLPKALRIEPDNMQTRASCLGRQPELVRGEGT